MATLELQESAVGAPNTGSHTLAAASIDSRPVLVRRPSPSSLPPPPGPTSTSRALTRPRERQVAAVGSRVDLLDENCKLVQALPLEHAFPGRSGDDLVEAVAVDSSSGQVRPALDELTPGSADMARADRRSVKPPRRRVGDRPRRELEGPFELRRLARRARPRLCPRCVLTHVARRLSELTSACGRSHRRCGRRRLAVVARPARCAAYLDQDRLLPVRGSRVTLRPRR